MFPLMLIMLQLLLLIAHVPISLQLLPLITQIL
jgi:hypothetical protein